MTSNDLIHWEVQPPCMVPGLWGLHEVPDVYELGGKWYLTVMAAYQNTGVTLGNDPLLGRGEIVAVADTPAGPFNVIRDNVAMAGTTCYSMRTVDFKGERLAYACRSTPQGGDLSLAVKLVPREGGGIQDLWWPNNGKLFGEKLKVVDAVVEGERKLDTLPNADKDFMMTATIILDGAQAAGLTFGQGNGEDPFTVFLNTEGEDLIEQVRGNTPGKWRVGARTWPVRAATEYRVRFLYLDKSTDIYVNDKYVINTQDKRLNAGSISLKAVGGKARFKDMDYWQPVK